MLLGLVLLTPLAFIGCKGIPWLGSALTIAQVLASQECVTAFDSVGKALRKEITKEAWWDLAKDCLAKASGDVLAELREKLLEKINGELLTAMGAATARAQAAEQIEIAGAMRDLVTGYK
jgi:Mg/Co/Ni transporter MgtE